MTDWIDIKEQRPPDNTLVLLAFDFKEGDEGTCYDYSRTIWITGEYQLDCWVVGNPGFYDENEFNLGFTEDNITHWMPLREPPR